MNHLIILPILWPLLVALLTMLPPFDQEPVITPLLKCRRLCGVAVVECVAGAAKHGRPGPAVSVG